jgi:recombination protein RecR
LFPKSFQKLIQHFSSWPSVGPKMAERLVLYLFKQDRAKIEKFAQDLHEFASNLQFCDRCFHVAEHDLWDLMFMMKQHIKQKKEKKFLFQKM